MLPGATTGLTWSSCIVSKKPTCLGRTRINGAGDSAAARREVIARRRRDVAGFGSAPSAARSPTEIMKTTRRAAPVRERIQALPGLDAHHRDDGHASFGW